jgi:hypothetical protein
MSQSRPKRDSSASSELTTWKTQTSEIVVHRVARHLLDRSYGIRHACDICNQRVSMFMIMKLGDQNSTCTAMHVKFECSQWSNLHWATTLFSPQLVFVVPLILPKDHFLTNQACSIEAIETHGPFEGHACADRNR